jgi:hypothetical protein
MSVSLADALRQVDLQGGRYQCQVGRFRVEVRVEETAAQLLPPPLELSDVMLDPWTDLPAPQSIALIQAAPGPPVLPDFPADAKP